MKKEIKLLIVIVVAFLAANLVFQSCQKDSYSPLRSSEDSTGIITERSPDSSDYYKKLVARCVAKGLGNTDFQRFFKHVAARGEGNQDGFSLWRYRDSLVGPNMTLAGFLSAQGSALGYSYTTAFFRGHLVRYIPNLAIGISIWDNVTVSDYQFQSTLKVAALPSDYCSGATTAGNSTMYNQSQVTSMVDVDNANYDFIYVEENPYYELFKASNNKSLNGDKTVPELHALSPDAAFTTAFATDVSSATYKFRLPGTEMIGGSGTLTGGTSCYLVDKHRVMEYYTGNGGDGGDGDPGPGGEPGDDPIDERDGKACTGECERDNLDGYERVRFVQMTDGSDLKKKFGCKRTKHNCTFAITQYRLVLDANSSAAVASQTTKIVNLWERGLRNGLWVWWNDDDNKYVKWNYCPDADGNSEYGDQMLYNVTGKNPQAGNETTTTFTFNGTAVFKIFGLEVTLPLAPGFTFSKKKTNKDFDFGQTENVYYCDPCSANAWNGQTYSTGAVRLRVREME